MTGIPAGSRIYLACGHTDMRKGFDTLAVLVQQVLAQDPYICVGREYVAAWSRSRCFRSDLELRGHIISHFPSGSGFP